MAKSVLSAAANLDIRGLGAAILADLTALRTKVAALVTDLTSVRTKVVAAVVDLTAARGMFATAMMSPAGLAVASGKKTATAAKPFMAMVGATPVLKAAGDMSALVGTLATAKSAGWAFYMDNAGTITTSAKTADADTVAAAFALIPAVPASKVQIGFIIVSNATGSNFVGGTTDLDAASVTTIYVDTVGNPNLMGVTAADPAAMTATAPAALETIA